ncbi:PAS domain-containing sensor histidine kinase [Salinibacter grassmerensis]|uniref:PAS domain-containing sensor histidine kinase n=1 Tax=Salinibacter grassmerensis TaxID=3040353 RepID=UPI0021E741EC|nr:ATP-binding protein [Salinibacter grassmerensis]
MPTSETQGSSLPEDHTDAEATSPLPEQSDFADAVLAAMPDPVFVFGPQNTLAWGNDPLQRAIGHSAAALRGKSLSDLFGKGDAASVEQTLDAVRAERDTATAEVALIPREGPARPCTFTARPLSGDVGPPNCVVGIARMAPLSAAQDETLRLERDRLAALYTGLPSPVVHYEVRSGAAIARGANVAFEETFGLSRSEVVGRDLDALLAPDERLPQAETLTQQAIEEGSVQAEVIRETDEGRRHFRLNSVLFSDSETPEGYAIYTDITEQKEREQTLRAEQEALRSMYRITADQNASFEDKVGCLIELGCDYLDLPYGFLTRISDGTQHILEATGDHPLLQPGESCPLSKSYCRETAERDALLAIQDVAPTGWTDDPAYEEFELGAYIGSQILVDGGLYGTLCFAASDARDTAFTERERTFMELMTRWASYELEQRRATEQLERQNERLDNFAGLVAHDLRNPLNVAKGRLELAADTEDLSHLPAIGRALGRMDEIIEDLLAITWGGQKLSDADLGDCDLASLIASCWERVDVPEAQLVVEDPPCVYADESRLQRLLENLFRNAIEHGGDDVTLRVGALDDGFFVEDDGPGIPSDQEEDVLKAGYSSDEEGTGLGLSIVKTIVDAHGWSLELTEGRDGGARFEVTGTEVDHG